MNIKTAIVLLKGDEIKVKISEMEKPIKENKEYELDFYKRLAKWQQSFKEYPVKDEKEWDKYIRLTYGNNINLALSKGISIDPSLIEIIEPDVNSVTKFEPFAVLIQPTVKEGESDFDPRMVLQHFSIDSHKGNLREVLDEFLSKYTIKRK